MFENVVVVDDDDDVVKGLGEETRLKRSGPGSNCTDPVDETTVTRVVHQQWTLVLLLFRYEFHFARPSNKKRSSTRKKLDES
jgi:hypothetical protein